MSTRTEHWALVAAFIFAAGGCASAPTARTAMAAKSAVASGSWPPPCLPCSGQTRETERLRQELAMREAEVRELRSSERVRVEVLRESKREATRAKVKLRRMATRADAASYIAEVEVAMDSLRSSPGARSDGREAAAAQRLLDSTAAPFAAGDYGTAMDRAARAEQLIADLAESRSRQRFAERAKTTAHRATLPKAAVAGKTRGRTPAVVASKTSE